VKVEHIAMVACKRRRFDDVTGVAETDILH